MEDEEYQIKNIDFGNYALDMWLADEVGFKKRVIASLPFRVCLGEVYKVLANLGELPIFWKSKEDEIIKEARLEAWEWSEEIDDNKIDSIAKCILVISSMAGKRLNKQGGF